MDKPFLPNEKNRYFVFGILLFYCIIELTGTAFHVLWADELHSWSIALNSHSVSELLRNKSYEGHPVLWYFILYGIKTFTMNLAGIKIVHSVIAICSVYLFLRFGPFTRLQKSLFVLGYYPLFEYAIINRNYAIEVLLLIIFLVLFRERYRFPVLISIVLFLVMQTNVFGIILTIAFILALVFEILFIKKGNPAAVINRKSLIVPALVLSAGFLIAILSIRTPSNYFITYPLPFGAITIGNFLNSVASFWRGMVPVPAPVHHFWDTNFVGPVIVQFVLAVGLLFTTVILFSKRPLVLLLFSTGMAGMLLFVFDFYTGSLRHHGHYYLLFIACLWISGEMGEEQRPFRLAVLEKYYRFLTRNRNLLLTIFLAIHMGAGVYSLFRQVFTPFSDAKLAADYIRENKLDRFTIAGDWDWYAASVEAHSNKDFYYYARNAFTKFVILDNKRTEYPQSEIIRRTDSLSRAINDTLLVVLNYPLKNAVPCGFRPVATFTGGIHPLEQYYLYLYY
jgi:hypothetical protein